MVQKPIEITKNFKQAGETYGAFKAWERDELIQNLVAAIAPCDAHIKYCFDRTVQTV
ncbi:catalase-related domain-containing protein [Ferroacidibacillus organovorans]|uniref:catalase-related domain-containing protein n=1 Tax=Ferroacidibacillus organovorans TaxID=1765683 RepID=UPI000A6C12BB